MTPLETDAFDEFLARYGPEAGEIGPERLVLEVLGVEELDPWQVDTLRAFGRGVRGISIAACHGPGKTALAAWIVWIMLLTRYPQKSVATAPSRGQLEDALVAEVIKWGNQLPPPLLQRYEFKKNRIELRASPENSFFSARTAAEERPEALAGVHSDHVLLIGDEAPGVPEVIFEAAAGSMSGHNATTLLLGNPTRSSGFFYDTHHKLRDYWFTARVGYRDSKRVTDQFAEDMARRYGEESNQYRVRVLGLFPLADDDTVIPFDLIDSAQTRDVVVPPDAPEIWGVDVARFGADANALVRRSTMAVSPRIMQWHGQDLMVTAGRVKGAYDDCPVTLRPEEILIDSIGLGSGVLDRLAEQGLPVRGINVSESPALKEKYRNLRAELWFRGREWLSSRRVKLPSDRDPDLTPEERKLAATLATELGAPRYTLNSSGRILVEAKAELKSRGFQSPNVADAFLLTFAGEPAAMSMGSDDRAGWSRGWRQPLSRGLTVV